MRIAVWSRLGLVLGVLVGLLVVPQVGSVGSARAAVAGPELVAFAPFRAADTRSGLGVRSGVVPAGGTLEVPVGGVLGVPASSPGVYVTVTGVQAAAAGDVTVWPCGSARPAVPLLRLVAGGSAANGTLVKLGTGGKVCVYATQAAHVLVDVSAFVRPGAAAAAVVPARVLDTRTTSIVKAGTWRAVVVAGKGGIPTTAVGAVLNLTALSPVSAGRISVAPSCGTGTPGGTVLSFAAGQQVSASAAVGLVGGKACVWSNVDAQILLDAAGYFATGSKFRAMAPGRLLDTQGGSPVPAGSVREVVVAGKAGVPVDAAAAALSIKAVSPTETGSLLVYPCGDPRPTASTGSYQAGRPMAAPALVELGAGGKVCVYTSKQTHLIVDVTGSYAAAAVGPGASAVSVGGQWEIEGFVCSLMPGGTVKCWGENSSGQLGDGTTTDRTVPVQVAGITRATAVAAGDSGACALVAGTVRCWGGGSTAPPATVAGISGATAISGTCAIVAGGAVKCWGGGAVTTVAGITGATSISGNCAIVAGGAVKCWEGATVTTIAGITGATSLDNEGYACAVVAGGAVKCWTRGVAPVSVPGISGAVGVVAASAVLSGEGFFDLNSGCALLASGSVSCWRNNWFGQLGQPSGDVYVTPVAVPGLSGASALSAANRNVCAITAGGSVRCWGENDSGQLGDGTATGSGRAVAAAGVTGGKALSVGGQHSCAVVSGGAVKCWGGNDTGQLATAAYRLVPFTVPGISGATDVAAGGTHWYHDDTYWVGHSCAVVAGGAVKCWGDNTSGQLGDGTTTGRSAPVAVTGLTGATAVTAGEGVDVRGDAQQPWGLPFGHTCSIVAGGAVKCWGDNYYGQLGDGSKTGRRTPVAVAGLTGATDLAVGARASCAVVAGGAVKCWGNGTGLKPTAVPGVSGATAVAVGDGRACARTSTGKVLCWTIGGSATQQPGISGATAVSVSSGKYEAGLFGHACAVVAGGALKCWGANGYGQLGDGTGTYRSTPVTVLGVSGAVGVGAGNTHTCALFSAGTVKCWGDNWPLKLGASIGPSTVRGL